MSWNAGVHGMYCHTVSCRIMQERIMFTAETYMPDNAGCAMKEGMSRNSGA